VGWFFHQKNLLDKPPIACFLWFFNHVQSQLCQISKNSPWTCCLKKTSPSCAPQNPQRHPFGGNLQELRREKFCGASLLTLRAKAKKRLARDTRRHRSSRWCWVERCKLGENFIDHLIGRFGGDF